MFNEPENRSFYFEGEISCAVDLLAAVLLCIMGWMGRCVGSNDETLLESC